MNRNTKRLRVALAAVLMLALTAGCAGNCLTGLTDGLACAMFGGGTSCGGGSSSAAPWTPPRDAGPPHAGNPFAFDASPPDPPGGDVIEPLF